MTEKKDMAMTITEIRCGVAERSFGEYYWHACLNYKPQSELKSWCMHCCFASVKCRAPRELKTTEET
jgi:hypothetical protein